MKNDQVQHRLSEVIDAIKAEKKILQQRLEEANDRLKGFEYALYGEHAGAVRGNGTRRMSIEAREAISEAQKRRWAKARRTERGRKTARHLGENAKMPPWTDKQDAMIVKAVKLKGPVDATEIARLLAGTLKRTPTAVRQHIARLAKRGVLKESGKGIGSHHNVEVA